MKNDLPAGALASLRLISRLTPDGRADLSPVEIRELVAEEYLPDHHRAMLLDFADAKERHLATAN